MSKKQINKSIMYVFLATFVLSSIAAVSNTNTAFAFLGFLLGGGDESDTGASTSTGTTPSSSNTAAADGAAEDQTPSSSYTKSQSSSSLQNAECYSPQGHVIDSCNSGDLSDNTDDGYITSSEYRYQYQNQ
ncbi:hypothetical protein BH23THE1_BH23THE1_30160 [soil metagenome]